MSSDQARNTSYDYPMGEHLTCFLSRLRDAEIALQEYLAAQNNSPEITSNNVPGAEYLSFLRERAEKARFNESIELDRLSQEEIKYLFHELQVHQIELRMQNDELRRVQLELEISRDRFSSLYDFAPIGYCTIDRRGIVLEANSTLCGLLGVQGKALIQNHFQDYIDKEEQDRFYLYQQAAIKNRSSQICEILMTRPSGERFTAQLESRTVPDQPERLWLVVSDISNLKRGKEIAARYEAVLTALDAIEIERTQYRDLFESDPDGYFVTDKAAVIQDVNRAGVALIGIPKDELIRTSLSSYILPEYQGTFQDQMNFILESRMAKENFPFREWEAKMRSIAGVPNTVLVSGALLREKPGNPIRVRWQIRDVTFQKQTEAALGKSQLRFHALFEESSIGIRLFDEQGKSLASNRALQEILGYKENELSQIPLSELTDLLDRGQDEMFFQSLLSGEIDRYIIEKRVIRKDGATVWVHQIVFWVRDQTNQSKFIVAMTENISDRKQMESDLAEIRKRLIDRPEAERLSLSQDLHDGPMQILYGVSYKLKSLCLEGNHTAEDDRLLLECNETISQVIRELRGFASELRPPTLMTFGLEKAIRSHVEQFKGEHPEIKVNLKLAPDGKRLPERVRLALFRIYQQAVANIIRHAQASKIQIQLSLDDHSTQLKIEDNGCGFDVPQRLVGLVRKGHLGLVGAAERAEAIGGKMTIASQPGKGTSILVVVNLTPTSNHESEIDHP